MRASDFAIAALYTLSVLDKEVAKLQAPGGSKQRPADAYAIVEVTVYIARNLRRAISVGQELGMTTTKMLMLCDSVEGALAKDDLPGAASALLSDSIFARVLPIVLDTRAPIEMPLPSGALSSQLLRSLLEERGIFPASRETASCGAGHTAGQPAG